VWLGRGGTAGCALGERPCAWDALGCLAPPTGHTTPHHTTLHSLLAPGIIVQLRLAAANSRLTVITLHYRTPTEPTELMGRREKCPELWKLIHSTLLLRRISTISVCDAIAQDAWDRTTESDEESELGEAEEEGEPIGWAAAVSGAGFQACSHGNSNLRMSSGGPGGLGVLLS
jgi:hypothetical protein